MLNEAERTGAVLDAHPLTDQEVVERQARYGPNILVPERRSSFALWIVRFFFDPMVLLLITAGATYLALGDRLDAGVAFGALLPIFLVTAVLEGRSDRALEELKRLARPTATVRRGSHDVLIDARELVPGDIMLVKEGDVFAADGMLIGGDLLIVDESALTGESQPVVKEIGTGSVFAGTSLRSGRGEILVTAIGQSTKYGRIGKLMSELHVTATPIERVIRRLVTQLGIVVILLCIVVIAVERAHGSAWPIAIIAGVSLAMAAFPEELPTVYTLYLALGAWRLAKQKALVRRLASVETLGSTNVICVDKTGTLTYGKLRLGALWHVRDDDAALLGTAVRATEPRPFDPLDEATQKYAGEQSVDIAFLERERPVVTFPFDAAHRRVTKVWKTASGTLVVTKGATEVVLDLCDCDDDVRRRVQAKHEEYAREGMRVLAVAEKRIDDVRAKSRSDLESHLEIVGLLAFSDPIREDVPPAIAACQRANIGVMMITGDHPSTALAIARSLGLSTAGALTGSDLERAHDDELVRALGTVRVFARIAPEQKLRIVQALHARGDIVAMTGDGTNDALALREADIGIAMGQRGTDVARAAADLILLDDNFTTIVDAVAGGRRIFRNLRRAFRYLNAFHLPLIVAAVLIPLLNVPLLLLPIHLVWLELIVHPTSALVYENDPGGEEDLMTQPPRGRTAGLMRLADWVRPLLLGFTLFLGCFGVYFIELRQGVPVEVARATGLLTMLFGQMLLVLVERSAKTPVWRLSLTNNPRLLPIPGGTIVMILVMFYVPALARAFRVAPPSIDHLLLALGIAALCTLWYEPFKRSHSSP
ncbi:MAG TPA: cation-transporting P-type ATPase [Candidatus Aquilonibacter sp.]|nr:cation-transporting P-type ATPase [Candidatus Aquilonibacter sp.]